MEAIVEGRWQKEQVQLVGEQRQVDLQRLDLVLNAIWERVLHGDLSAIDRYMKVAEHRPGCSACMRRRRRRSLIRRASRRPTRWRRSANCLRP